MGSGCLFVPDILYRILDFLEIEPNTDFYAGYHQPVHQCPSIARLARTCKGFLEPSLNALWRRQLTLGPLVHTLPGDSFNVVVWKHPSLENYLRAYIIVGVCLIPSLTVTVPELSLPQTITRPLLATDWIRFD
ncbi:hypothetical protein GY45DRAFT_323013 [Cubamyces sp. BRFM 1775]|nr:hypothetical protein GY45DRAFT_323013 [Cubamyces sp. BRFM 1775]